MLDPRPVSVERRMQRPRKHVAFVTSLDVSLAGGPSDHVIGLVTGLARHTDITLLSPTPRERRRIAFPEAVTWRHFPNVGALHLPGAFGTLLALRQMWRLRGVDAVHCRNSAGTLPLAIAARLLRVPRLTVEHNGWMSQDIIGFGYWRGLANLGRALQVAEARLADANRVVTGRIGDLLVARGVDAGRVTEIGNGTDTTVFHPLDTAACRAALGLAPSSRPVLGYLGNLWSGCGVDTVLAALAILKAEGREVTFLVAGGGRTQSELESRAQDLLGAGHHVHFFGQVDADRGNVILGACDAAVAPYKRARNADIGISSLKVRAYAAAGKVCVVSDLPGMTDAEGEPWLVAVEAEDPAAFAAGLAAAFAVDHSAAGAAARRYAVAHYDWSAVADRVADLLGVERG